MLDADQTQQTRPLDCRKCGESIAILITPPYAVRCPRCDTMHRAVSADRGRE